MGKKMAFCFVFDFLKRKCSGSIYPRKKYLLYDEIELSRSQISDEDVVMINKTLLMVPEPNPH